MKIIKYKTTSAFVINMKLTIKVSVPNSNRQHLIELYIIDDI